MQRLLLVLAALLASPTIAQNPLILSIDVKATYLHTRNDDIFATTATPIHLASIGATPGQWIRVATQGAYQSMGQDNRADLTCVFSSTGTVLPANQLNRVPGALPAGPTIVTGVWQVNNNIAQDFYAPVTYVQVPQGAIFLFVSPVDDYHYGANTDPNNDFRLELSVQAPPSLCPGTQEHAEIRTGISPQVTTAFPDRYLAPPNSLISVTVHDRWGARAGDAVVLLGELVTTTPTLPSAVLPGIYLSPSAVFITAGVVSSTPLTHFQFVPPGFGGNTLQFQAGFIGSAARNGWVMSTDMHLIDL